MSAGFRAARVGAAAVVGAAVAVGAAVEAGSTTVAGAGRVPPVVAAGELVVVVAAVVESNESDRRGIEPMLLRWRLLGLLVPPLGVIVS